MKETQQQVEITMVNRLPERCCPPGQCCYRVSETERYVKALRRLARDREGLADEVTLRRRTDAGSLNGEGLGAGNSSERQLIRLVDVQMAVEGLRREGRVATDEAVAKRLCPFALDDSDIPVDTAPDHDA